MNVTEPIIQAALLGTANREFVPGAFPESLQTLVDGIHGKAEDTESFLYMTAASAFAYRRAGWEPAGAEGIVPVKTAPEEELPYFDKDRSQLFSRLHGTRYMLAYAYRLAQGSWEKSFRPNTSSRLSGVPMTATIRCGLKNAGC